MKLFDQATNTPIILETGTDEAIRLAAADLQRNLRQLSGQTNGFPLTEDGAAKGIRIGIRENGEIETYTVRVEQEQVHIHGSDTLGTVFGIYAFATRCLDILPIYRLIDRFPDQRESMELSPQTFSSGTHPVRFRGWFLNDEDLLTDFHLSGGHRAIDYPYYENVMDTDVLDMILETALRLEVNLVIPSSFVDIHNPDEEKLVRAVVRRGLYISQHHVEPVGVSYFAADAYMKRYGAEGEVVSFLSNRARMEEIWRYYIEKWAQYGERVIWQFGLRGKADQAVWKSDPNVPMDDAARGAIITDAIATQHRLVCEVTGKNDFHSTATLWLEGAALYGKGHLRIPENTTVVFSDIGYSQMFGDDFYGVARRSTQRYGIYYHVGFWAQGPHLAEGCDLKKMAFSYEEAWKYDSLYYSILNVSNVRPLHFSTWFQAELIKCPRDIRASELFDRQLRALFGRAADTVKPLYEDYYRTIADLGKDELRDRCKRSDFYYHDYGPLPYAEFPATDGVLRTLGRKLLGGSHYTVDDERLAATLEESLANWEALYADMQKTEKALPERSRLYFGQFLCFETLLMMQLTRWFLACRRMVQATEPSVRTAAKQEAVAALERILQERVILERGDWKNWHRGEKKIGVISLIAKTEEIYESGGASRL